MGITTSELSPIEQTAFLTEYARALDSHWPQPILDDRLAYEVRVVEHFVAQRGLAHHARLHTEAGEVIVDLADEASSPSATRCCPRPSIRTPCRYR